MAIQTTYTHARANLAKLCNEVILNQEVVIINWRGAQDVALISAAELASLTETAHLLRSLFIPLTFCSEPMSHERFNVSKVNVKVRYFLDIRGGS